MREIKILGRSLAVIAIALATLVYVLIEMRWDAIETATYHANELATALAEDVANSVATLDLTLRDAADIVRAETNGETITALRAGRIRRSLKDRHEALLGTDLIAITNESGDVLVGASDSYERRINVSDRDYFRQLRDLAGDHLVISKPLTNKFTGALTIFFARRLEDTSGRFLGVAIVGLKPSALFQGREELVADVDRSYGLFYEDGSVALREPAINVEPGEKFEEGSAWYAIAARNGGLLHAAGPFDGRSKYIAVHRVRGRPLFVNVGISDRAALANWRFRAATILCVCLVGVALTIRQLLAQSKLSNRLSRARYRAWLRTKQLAAQESELQSTRERFGLTLDYMSQGMALFDANRKLLASNKSYAELYNLDPRAIRTGMDVTEIYTMRIAANDFRGETGEEYIHARTQICSSFDRVDRMQSGRIIHVRGKSTQDGGRLTVHEDITDRIRVDGELLRAARTDGLTHLANRRAFQEELQRKLASTDTGPFAIVLTDIDDFKAVNDSYGHEVADGVLREVSDRLSRENKCGHTARLGGDEFAALIPLDDASINELREIGSQLLRALREPIHIGGRRISLNINVGVKIAEPGTHDFELAMRNANLALAMATREGPNACRVFDREMERRHNDKLQLAQDLRLAITGDQLEVHYQPIVEPRTGEYLCMEALARWRHPTRGLVPPLVFIPLAEEMGLINDIGDWILRRACLEAAQWKPDIVVAVNVSALQVERCDYVATITEALEIAGLPPHRLQLEITESVLLRNNEATRDHLISIRAMGVTFALDDFGTGYASLSYLKAFPLDKIKIDKTFVDDICVNPQSIAIIGAIVSLATGIGVLTTAEGVESKEQVEALRMIGVTTMQGYYFSKPKPVRDHDPNSLFCSDREREVHAA